jgi:Concanavalin A-like lectin/glucanases superfamily/Secretion system C-terminal sorting domain
MEHLYRNNLLLTLLFIFAGSMVFAQTSKNVVVRTGQGLAAPFGGEARHEVLKQMLEKRKEVMKAREARNAQKTSKAAKASSVRKPLPLIRPPTNITVTSNSDANWDATDYPFSPQTASGDTTLRSAIQFANDGGVLVDTIFVPAGTYTLTLAGSDEDDAATGDLDINRSLVMIGTGEGETIIDGNELDRVFDVNPFNAGGIAVKFSNLTITGGLAPSDEYGGGMQIFNDGGTVELDSVDVSYNVATYGGGLAIEGSANVTAKYCTFSHDSTNNSLLGYGGGISNDYGNLSVDHCIFRHNHGDLRGGAIDLEAGDNFISNCVIDSNSSHNEGTIYAWGNSLTMTNDTVAWNSSGWCGGLHALCGFTMQNSAVMFNTSTGYIGGIELEGAPNTLSNVLIYGNHAANDFGGVYIAGSPVYFLDVVVDSNSVGGIGGGIYDSYGGLTWVGGRLSRNIAGSSGGGIFFSGSTADDSLLTVKIGNNTPDDIINSPIVSYHVVLTANALTATNVTRTSAHVNGLIIPGGSDFSVGFKYGTVSGVYPSTVAATPGTVSGTGSDSVSAALTGLTPGTIYYYRVFAFTGSPADTFFSSEQSFMTISTTAGNALKFDGSDDAVEIPYTASLNPSGDFTVELWARVDGNDGTWRTPLSSRGDRIGYNFYASYAEGGPNDNCWEFWFGVYSYGNWVALVGPPVVDGQWTHLAAVHDGTTFTFYVNGMTVATDSGFGFEFTPNSTNDFFLGCNDGGPGQAPFNGTISETRFWNCARSQSEIQSTMNATLTGTESGLVAYWQLNESGTNTTAYEEVGGYNGTLNNFTFMGDGWTPASDLSLPVQATNFLAKADVGSVTLSWKTGAEVDNAGFVILRRQISDIGARIVDWEPIASYISNNALKGMGTSSTGESYSFTDSKVKSGASYQYKIQSVTTKGVTTDLTTLQVIVGIPKEYALYQNYPNPFNPTTTIRFDLKQASTVTLEIYNVLGQNVMEQSYGSMNAGRYNEVVSMEKYASGVYYYRINAAGNDGQRYVSVKKLVLMK